MKEMRKSKIRYWAFITFGDDAMPPLEASDIVFHFVNIV